MDLTRLATRYPVTVWMCFLALLLLGVVSYSRMPTDLLPSAERPRFRVVTRMPGFTADEVERLVTAPMERRIASLRGVSRVASLSREDFSVITVDCDWETDRDLAQIDLLERDYRTKLEIDAHYTLQRALRWWLWLHVPASLVLLVFVAVHLFTVLYY